MEVESEVALQKHIPILVVDDDEGLRGLVIRRLVKGGYIAVGASTGAEAIVRVLENPHQFLLLDQQLSDMTGHEVIEQLSAKNVPCHFLMMTGQGDERLAVEMMKLGASDYLVKDTEFLERLPGILERIFHSLETEQRLHHSEEEKDRLQLQLIQSQKMDAIGQLAGGVAHDFNNILGGIIGATELLLDPGVSESDRLEYLQMIATTAQRGAELTRKLLTFSRKGAPRKVPVDCASIINEIAVMLRRTIDKRISVSVENHAESTMIVGDDSLIQSVFLNLGINASHAMPEGGQLTYTIAERDLDDTYCSICPFEIHAGKYLKISVKDTGCGMSTEIQNHIFEPFFTTKAPGKGTGLGLAAVYGAVQDHGGALSVYSEVGTGSVFHVYLPLSESTDVDTVIPPLMPISGTGTILLIDDEEIIRVTAGAILQNLGYTVHTASDGKSGLDLYKELQTSIDLILLDMIMPIQGGNDTFNAIRDISSTVPVIIASGFSKPGLYNEMQQRGVSGFITKPYTKLELSQIVASVIGK